MYLPRTAGVQRWVLRRVRIGGQADGDEHRPKVNTRLLGRQWQPMRSTWFVLLLMTLMSPGAVAGSEEIGWKASGKGGAVAAGNAGAVEAGIAMLRQRGNAADAAAATILALAVTDYGSFSIGGEVPLLIYLADRQEVKVLCGVGCVPLDPKAIEWLYANGIPSKGSMKATPVPGAVDLCVTLLKALWHEVVGGGDCPNAGPARRWRPRLAPGVGRHASQASGSG